jgi:hypothetical protein
LIQVFLYSRILSLACSYGPVSLKISYYRSCHNLRKAYLHKTIRLLILPTIRSDFCGLVFRVPGYESTGPGSIPSATRFSEK